MFNSLRFREDEVSLRVTMINIDIDLFIGPL